MPRILILVALVPMMLLAHAVALIDAHGIDGDASRHFHVAWLTSFTHSSARQGRDCLNRDPGSWCVDPSHPHVRAASGMPHEADALRLDRIDFIRTERTRSAGALDLRTTSVAIVPLDACGPEKTSRRHSAASAARPIVPACPLYLRQRTLLI